MDLSKNTQKIKYFIIIILIYHKNMIYFGRYIIYTILHKEKIKFFWVQVLIGLSPLKPKPRPNMKQVTNKIMNTSTRTQ